MAKVEVVHPDEKKLKEMGVFSWPVWTKDPSEFPWHYDDRETCYLLEGEAEVATNGETVKFGAGDLVTFPRGIDCRWRIFKAVRKHYKFG
ncbi:MAG TPA: DUF861 domain-containing protein [Planctomycetes bacterium]|nr:DUF861 domain-containing protein [Planctomycetota bacterium]